MLAWLIERLLWPGTKATPTRAGRLITGVISSVSGVYLPAGYR